MILVSVIGDYFSSVAPIFYQLKDEIKTHIIISDKSERSKKKAHKFKKGVDGFCDKYNLDIRNTLYTIDEHSFSSIDKAIRFIFDLADKDIFINTTDGLSFINTYMSLKTLPLGAKIVSYDIFDNVYSIVDMGGIKKEKITDSVPIKDHFLLKGIEVLESKSEVIPNRHPEKIKLLFTKLFRDYIDFKRAYVLSANKFDFLFNNEKFKDVKRILKEIGLLDKFNKVENFNQVILGDPLEYYVYILAKELGFDDVRVGLRIENEGVENEFDVLLMKDNHLHVIECKNRRPTSWRNQYGVNLESLLFKYATLKSIIDDEGRGAVVITGRLSDIRYETIKRGSIHNITFMSTNRYLKDNMKRFFLEGVNDIYQGEFKKSFFKKRNTFTRKGNREPI
ncbi:Card1-like endonuclease domain-containing protein [Hippea sp. KM1]|uniref:Card1-like endonuclease domain-containing protein n=1 Tax=Hippea sp. KM1 TaxID=944481 RepID=UPI00046CAAF5|nr:DUF1887 family CARF protein [Hippea sp. KM1]